MRAGLQTHVWHVNPKDGVRKWCGQFYTPEDALSWRRKQANPEQYVLNNVGPVATGTWTPPRITAKPSQEAERLAQQRREDAKRQKGRRVRPPRPSAPVQRRTPDPAAADLRAMADEALEEVKEAEAEDIRQGKVR